jgi:hypothetical protein
MRIHNLLQRRCIGVILHAEFCSLPFQDFTVGALADSYYEYLLKVWLLGGKSDDNQVLIISISRLLSQELMFR